MKPKNLVEQLKRDEGCRLTAYKDTKGLWTIGVGHLLDQSKNWAGYTITQQEADQLLMADIAKHAPEITQLGQWVYKLDVVRKEALINLIFNMGVKRLLGFKNMLSHLSLAADGKDVPVNLALAAIELLDSQYQKDVGPRAFRIAKQLVTGERQ